MGFERFQNLIISQGIIVFGDLDTLTKFLSYLIFIHQHVIEALLFALPEISDEISVSHLTTW